jgi:hypothetical protein
MDGIPPDATLELPVQGIAVQIDDKVVLEDGTLQLLYMPLHKTCVVTLIVNEKVHASVPLDGPLFAVLAAFAADPTKTPLPGSIFKG